MVGHPGSFFFSERGSSIAVLHSSVSYVLGGQQAPLVSKDILEILGVHGNLHSIKKWYVDIKLLNYLDELAELLIVPASFSVPEMVRRLYRGTLGKSLGLPRFLPG
jgi:hypothetical protein